MANQRANRGKAEEASTVYDGMWERLYDDLMAGRDTDQARTLADLRKLNGLMRDHHIRIEPRSREGQTRALLDRAERLLAEPAWHREAWAKELLPLHTRNIEIAPGTNRGGPQLQACKSAWDAICALMRSAQHPACLATLHGHLSVLHHALADNRITITMHAQLANFVQGIRRARSHLSAHA